MADPVLLNDYTLLPRVRLARGTYQYEQALDARCNRHHVALERAAWPADAAVTVTVWDIDPAAPNGGFLFGFQTTGGTILQEDGLTPATHSWMSCGPVVARQRTVRVRVQVSKALDTSVRFQALREEVPVFPLHQSVAYDAVASTDFAGVTTSYSWTHTPVGTPTLATCLIGDYDSLGAFKASVTYGGAAMTAATQRSKVTVAPQVLNAEIWGKLSPATGAQTVQVNITGLGVAYGAAGSITVLGSDTSTAFDNTSAGSDGANVSTLTDTVTSATDDLVVCVVSVFEPGGTTATADAGQTDRFNRINAGSNTRGAASTEPGAASVGSGWTFGVAADYCVMVSASIKTAPGGPVGAQMRQIEAFTRFGPTVG